MLFEKYVFGSELIGWSVIYGDVFSGSENNIYLVRLTARSY